MILVSGFSLINSEINQALHELVFIKKYMQQDSSTL